ncbi:MAG: hypothetical protein EBR30_14575 [Cytophagia bacterium]|nr:hypothetical protein [Cytophagia bacterium]NBW36215.1 hypothetical protein [Cytophagia bacterium]
MLALLRYLLICTLVTFLSGSHNAFIEPVQNASITEQHEKTETENLVDEAIPSVRAKKQIAKTNNTLTLVISGFTTLPTHATKASSAIQEADLFLKYRKLII